MPTCRLWRTTGSAVPSSIANSTDGHRYACFIATDGASEFASNRADPPQATDFLLTITSLAARRVALGRDV
jgi:hypothetical protein